MSTVDPAEAKRVIVEANARFKAHAIATMNDSAGALEFVRTLHTIFEAGYRLQFVDARQRRAR